MILTTEQKQFVICDVERIEADIRVIENRIYGEKRKIIKKLERLHNLKEKLKEKKEDEEDE
jgi:Mg2+ and Co2+ transporter CorA